MHIWESEREHERVRVRETSNESYQITYILLWFGDVELHLVFNEELKS